MFYKFINNELIYGNEIINSNYHLTTEDTSIQIDGWKWFNTEEEAKSMSKNIIPINPIDLTSNNFTMFGLGSQIYVTPMQNGTIRFTIKFIPSGIGTNGLNSFKLVYGTGIPPSNNASATGSVIGGIDYGGVESEPPYTPSAIIRNIILTGLSVGTNYWFDIQGSKYTSNTSVGMKDIEVTLEELLS